MIRPLLVAALLFTVAIIGLAQVLLKLGLTRAAAGTLEGAPLFGLFPYLTEPRLIVGLMLYALAAVTWLYVLSRLPLSFAYPFVGLSFIAVLALSVFFLGEEVSPLRIAGTVLVALGVALVAASGGTP